MNNNSIPLGAINKITMGLLLVALLPLPYSYYMFLRWAVTISACIHLYYGFTHKRWIGVAICICLAALFNPFVPVFLTKSIWTFLDIGAAVLTAVAFKEISKKSESIEIVGE